MGEEPWRVHHAGAPSLDHMRRSTLLTRAALENRLGIQLQPTALFAAWHPVTILHDTTAEADAFFAALAQMPAVSGPASLRLSQYRCRQLRAHRPHASLCCETRPNTHIYVNLDAVTYWSLLGKVTAMIGNSSSGIMEAASFALPAVNIGIRQQGRERARNVIDAAAEAEAILAAIQRALSPEFRASLTGMTNPYGDGTAAETIARVLTTVPLENLFMK